MKFKFKITFKRGAEVIAVVDGVRELEMAEVKMSDMIELVPQTEAFLEKLTGYRVHIEQVN